MQVIALIGEFASRWLINVFDVTFSVYGEEHFGVSSSLYSYTTAVGSMVNIFQTGWLFNRLLRWDVSIPLITSMTGVCGAIGIFTCLFAPNKAVAILGSVFFIFAYGCAAPTAPTVMSVRLPSEASRADRKPRALAGRRHGVGPHRRAIRVHPRAQHPLLALRGGLPAALLLQSGALRGGVHQHADPAFHPRRPHGGPGAAGVRAGEHGEEPEAGGRG